MADNNMDWGRRFALIRRKHAGWWVSVHYSAERFAVMLIVSIVVIALVIALVIRDSRIKRDDIFATTSVYINSAVSSASQQVMNVEKLYVSSDNMTAFLLLKWDENALENVSLSVENYNVMLGARTPSMDVGGKPSAVWSGAVVIYGMTGYVGILLRCQETIPMEVLDLRIIIDDAIHEGEEQKTQEWGYDTSKGDQLTFRINPAIPNIPKLKALDEMVPDFYAIYNEAILEPLDKKLRAEAYDLLKTMSEDLRKIDEQEKRLEALSYGGRRVNMPLRSTYIDGDTVECDDDSCVLQTSTVIGGAWNLDWQNTSFAGAGYVDPNCESGRVETAEYMECVSEKYKLASEETVEETSQEWSLSDGTLLDLNSTDSGSSDTLEAAALNVEEARRKYFNDKKSYQTDIMYDFLFLTYTGSTMKENYKFHADSVTMMER